MRERGTGILSCVQWVPGMNGYLVVRKTKAWSYFFSPPDVYFSLVFAEYHVSVHHAAHPGMDDG